MDKDFSYDIFDAYQNNQITEAEKEAFEQRLSNDTAFAEEFELYQLMVGGIQATGKTELRNTINLVEQDLEQQNFFNNKAEARVIRMDNKTVSRKSVYAIAASIALLIGVAFFLFKDPNASYDATIAFAKLHQSETKVATKLIDELSAPGLGGDKALKESLASGLQQFKAAKYQDARIFFADYLQKQPEDYVAKLYLGLSLFEMTEYSNAVAPLADLAQKEDFEYRNTAKWYLALAYSQFKNKASYEEAKKILNQLAQDSESGYTKDAKTYLNLMK